MSKCWDVLISKGLVFDGSGKPPVIEDIAISQGRIVARGQDLDQTQASEIVDADGHWVMPGLIDLHTHLDLELEFDPSLSEAVRHGTTSVLVSNCSLGLAYGAQRRQDEDPIVDCFARVENMPKSVLRTIANQATWTSSAGYYAHLDELNLGCNVLPMIPHSMLRCEVMGLNGAVSRKASETDLQEMEKLLTLAMEEGYLGLSTDALPFHFLSEDPNRHVRIPSQFGRYKELRRLTAILRQYNRIWQATPPKENPFKIARNFLLTAGLFFGKPLKITAVAALDVASNKSIKRLALLLANIFNSRILKGNFKLQALAAPFKVFWDGPINPLAEEIPALRELNELDLEDREGRQALLCKSEFQIRFAKMWMTGKQGFGLNRLKRLIKMESLAFDRDLEEMVFYSGGPDIWTGETFQGVFDRFKAWLNDPHQARTNNEQTVFKALGVEAKTEPGFILALFRHFDLDLRWWTISANRDPETIRELLNHPLLLPGFNDSGAHITNMAFYDGNLRCLKIAQNEGLERVSSQIHRLTQCPAEFLGVDLGTLDVHARADITIINPKALASYDSEANTFFQWRQDYQHEQMVNRSDGVVELVYVGGQCMFKHGQMSKKAGQIQAGRAIRHKDWSTPGNSKNLPLAAE